MSAAEKMQPFKFRERPSIIKEAQAIADHRGDNLSEVIRDGLRGYVRKHKKELPESDAPPS